MVNRLFKNRKIIITLEKSSKTQLKIQLCIDSNPSDKVESIDLAPHELIDNIIADMIKQ